MERYAKEQRDVILSKEHPHGTKSWLMEAMMLYVAEEMAIVLNNNSSSNNNNNSAADEEARKYAMSTSNRIVDYIERIYQV
jgi:hypothetical protein